MDRALEADRYLLPDSPILSLAERDRRWAAMREMMERLDLEALVVFGLRGRERYEGYLSNESIEGIVILPLRGEPTYVTWTYHRVTRRFPSNMRDTDFWIEDVRAGPTGPLIAAALKEKNLSSSRIGVVGLDSKSPGEMEGIVPYRTWMAVTGALPDARFVDVTVEFGKVMVVKSAEELKLVRHAARIGEMACQAMLEVTQVGVRERDIYAAIMEVIHRNAAVGPPPSLIISIGADDIGWAPPYWTYAGGESRVVREGDLVQAEIFPAYAGMETQMQMSIAIEPVPTVLHELAAITRQSYEISLANARPGVSFTQLDEAMSVPARDRGCWTLTPLIHSVNPLVLVGRIGINIDNVPPALRHGSARVIPPLNDMVLEPGMVLALEPDACLDNHRVNIGGTIIISEDGCEELNQLPTRMIVKG